MGFKILRLIGAACAFIFFLSLDAQAAATGDAQNALIQVESSMVYDGPDFDAQLIDQIKGGQKVRISTKTYGHPKGARFYKIKCPDGKIGYVATIDVVTEGAHQQQVKKAHHDRLRATKLQKDWDKDTDKVNKSDMTIFETSYIGAFLGVWNYRQKIAGANASDSLAFYGLKLTSPRLIRGSMIEANLGFHLGAPDFYQRVSVGKPSGFLTDLDLLLIDPLLKGEHWMGYFGLGPLFHFRSITTSTATASVNSKNFRLGASFSLGGAYQFGRLCARLEGKYMWEQTSQTAFLASLQTSF